MKIATISLPQELYQKADPSSGPAEWRRKTDRRRIREAVYLLQEGSESNIFAHTRDVSLDSLGLSCKFQVMPGEHILVRLAYIEDAEWTKFVVRHCTNGLGGFNIGLSLI
jgi:hypothetical protein